MSERDDRPKRSFSEIDKLRDGRSARKEPNARESNVKPTSASYRQYKTQLNKIFDGGGLPDALKEKLGDKKEELADVERRKTLQQAIIEARTGASLATALATYEQAFGFPEDDEAALDKLVDLGSDAMCVRALRALARLLASGVLRPSARIKARALAAGTTRDDPDVDEAIQALLNKL